MFTELTAAGTMPEILFLEAADDVIVRRQESVRRPHPLQGDGRLLDGITRERETIATLRAAADLVIDTSSINIHQLSSRVAHAYGDAADDALRVTVVSFGFKNGIPVDADLVVDVRFLPNPHWVPELRPQTGLEPAGPRLRAGPGRRRGVPAAAAGAAPGDREGLHHRGQAVRHHRDRLHRWQAPQHRDGRGVRAPAAAGGDGRPRCCTATWAGSEPRRADDDPAPAGDRRWGPRCPPWWPSAAATGSRRRSAPASGHRPTDRDRHRGRRRRFLRPAPRRAELSATR